jgi:hypothetical protein
MQSKCKNSFYTFYRTTKFHENECVKVLTGFHWPRIETLWLSSVNVIIAPGSIKEIQLLKED